MNQANIFLKDITYLCCRLFTLFLTLMQRHGVLKAPSSYLKFRSPPRKISFGNPLNYNFFSPSSPPLSIYQLSLIQLEPHVPLKGGIVDLRPLIKNLFYHYRHTTKLVIYRSSQQRCSVKKGFSVKKKFRKTDNKTPVPESLFVPGVFL